jgi:threonine/homoserine/homoserine lactone efflux protein
MPLLIGMILGFLLAIPPGSIVVVGLNLTMALGWRRAYPYAVGTMIPDAAYALIALRGSDPVLNMLRYSAAHLPFLIVAIQSALATGLFVYGLSLFFRRSLRLTWGMGDAASSTPRGKIFARHGPFLLGLGLNASNIVSPTFLAALAILVSQAHVLRLLEGGFVDTLLYAGGFGIGNMLYLILVMRVAGKALRRLDERRMLLVQRVIGGILAGLALIMGVQFIQAARG